MKRQDAPDVMNTLHISTDEGLHAADLAERILPGGAGLVQGLVRAQREALKGLSALIEANVQQLEQLDESIADPNRERWTGGIGRGLLLLAAKRATAIHAAISQTEAAILRRITEGLQAEPAGRAMRHRHAARAEKVKIE